MRRLLPRIFFFYFFFLFNFLFIFLFKSLTTPQRPTLKKCAVSVAGKNHREGDGACAVSRLVTFSVTEKMEKKNYREGDGACAVSSLLRTLCFFSLQF